MKVSSPSPEPCEYTPHPGTCETPQAAPERRGQLTRDAAQTWGGTFRLCMIRLCNPSAVAVILLLNTRR